jgi:transcriptional regulator with XRE-family HTH domain
MKTSRKYMKHETAHDDAHVHAERRDDGDDQHRWLSSDERKRLGERAKSRRLKLGLSRKDVAAAINVPLLALFRWEQSLVRRPRPQEKRWEDALGVPGGWLRDLQALSGRADHGCHKMEIVLPEAATVADEIRAICCCLVRRSVAGVVPVYADLSACEQRRADMLALRRGVAGKEESILDNIGRRYGLSRQRIRTVVGGLEGRAGALRFKTPRFEQLAADVQRYLPASISALNEQLRCLLGEALSIQHADEFARQLLGKPIARLIEQPAGASSYRKPFAVREERRSAEIAVAVQGCATRMVRRFGAARISSVYSAISAVLPEPPSMQETLALCKLVDGFEWLIEHEGWFWFGPACVNRMIAEAAKVLAAARRQVSVEEIQRVLQASGSAGSGAESRRTASIEPPLAVMTAILKRSSWIELVQHGAFRSRTTMPVEGLLSGTQSAAYCFLSPADAAARSFVAREPVDPALVRSMMRQRSLDHPPAVTRLGHGVYALRASWLAPGAFAGAGATQRQVDTNAAGTGADDAGGDGWYHASLLMTAHSFKARTWSVPHAIARVMVTGEYRVDGYEVPVHFTVYGNGAKRLRKFIGKLIQAGMRVNDHALLSIHPEQRRIRIKRIVGAGLDERMRDQADRDARRAA